MSALSVPLRRTTRTHDLPPTPGSAPVSSMLEQIPRGAKVLWVTSTGGHLAELNLIAERLQPSAGSRWVTFETAQSVDALRDRPHLFVDYVSPRDVRAAVRAARNVLPLLRRERFDACVSTGAGVAATVLPLAAWSGIPTYYVESLARPHGPSTTGRILAHVPRVRTATQYASWAGARWSYAGSILQDWRVEPGPGQGRDRSRSSSRSGRSRPTASTARSTPCSRCSAPTTRSSGSSAPPSAPTSPARSTTR